MAFKPILTFNFTLLIILSGFMELLQSCTYYARLYTYYVINNYGTKYTLV